MINIGVIGCGYWGPNYVRVFNELQNSKSYYACDLDMKKMDQIKKLNPSTLLTENYENILANPDIHAVCICTPASKHFEIAKKALLAGKDVLVEKPLALSSVDVKELMQIANEKKRILMVGHVYKFNPGIEKLKELIVSGELGRIYYIHLLRIGFGPFRTDVNAMWDLAPHDISIVTDLLGSEPLSVSATGASYLQPSIEDVVFLTLNFPNKVIAGIHVSWLNAYKDRTITVIGSKKTAVFDDIKKELKIYDKSVTANDNVVGDYSKFQFLVRDGDITIPKLDSAEPLKKQCMHFLDCIEKRNQPTTDARDGLKVIKILEAGQRSLKQNGIPTTIE
jgi:predicted dehydrogenase